MTVQDDKILVEAIRIGDEGAFKSVFTKYYPLLCSYGQRYVGVDETEEVVQDVMMWLWENREVIVFESSLINYLISMVKNKCMTRINRQSLTRRIQQTILDDSPTSDDFNPYAVVELTSKIELAIEKLPEAYRESFELNRYEYMSYKEIANMLGVSPKTIDYRIQQALKILREQLKDFL